MPPGRRPRPAGPRCARRDGGGRHLDPREQVLAGRVVQLPPDPARAICLLDREPAGRTSSTGSRPVQLSDAWSSASSLTSVAMGTPPVPVATSGWSSPRGSAAAPGPRGVRGPTAPLPRERRCSSHRGCPPPRRAGGQATIGSLDEGGVASGPAVERREPRSSKLEPFWPSPVALVSATPDPRRPPTAARAPRCRRNRSPRSAHLEPERRRTCPSVVT